MRKLLTIGAMTVFLAAALTLSCSDNAFSPDGNSTSGNQDSRIERYRVHGIIYEHKYYKPDDPAPNGKYEVKFYFYHPIGMEYLEIPDENPPCKNGVGGYYNYNGDDGEGYPSQFLWGKMEAWNVYIRPNILRYTEYFSWDTFEYVEKDITIDLT